MEIKLQEITIRELINGYQNNDEEGVFGYGGKLNIRPPYQREFVYDTDRKRKVIDSIMRKFPLNVMYWSVNSDGTYEVLDGQQRIMSICEFCTTNQSFGFKIDGMERGFQNLTSEQQEDILEYPLMVYFCEGTANEKLEWFKTVNIKGLELKDQEMRNAIYCGSWVSDAKKYFSKTNSPAKGLADKYLLGVANRQDYLQEAIKWISDGNIERYMSLHQHDPNAIELWLYFVNVIEWVKVMFPKYRKEMKGIDWGKLYKSYKDTIHNTDELEKEITALMQNEEIQSKKGIYTTSLQKTRNTSISGSSPTISSRKCMTSKREYANGAESLSDWRKWRLTTLSRGVKVAKRT